MSIHFHSLIIKDIRPETSDCVSVSFDIPDELKNIFIYKPGQNITLRSTVNGEEMRRSYSVCSSPLDNELRVAVKQVEQGKFSHFVHSSLKKGDRIDVLPPTGKFYTELNPSLKKEYLAFAAGSGITPILSIIKTTLLTEPESNFTLVYGNRNRSSIIFREALESLKNKFINRFRIIHILSREKTDIDLYHGHIDAQKSELLGQHLIRYENMDHIFLCGPEKMIFTLRDFLLSKNIDANKIHFELFNTPGQSSLSSGIKSSTQTNSAEKSIVTIKQDGISLAFELAYDGETILDAALRQGADLPFACKGGVCSTCRAKLTEGKVEMDLNYALEPDEETAGFILTCQSHPRSPAISIDFDQK